MMLGWLQLGDCKVMRTMMRPEELEVVIVGRPDLDFEALEKHTQYEDGFVRESEVRDLHSICSGT